MTWQKANLKKLTEPARALTEQLRAAADRQDADNEKRIRAMAQALSAAPASLSEVEGQTPNPKPGD